LLDVFGNSLWQYETLGNIAISSFITYKEIDASRDMMLAASGGTNIKFTRIISSTITPFTVDIPNSKNFRDNF
jgi:hypothetical protein